MFEKPLSVQFPTGFKLSPVVTNGRHVVSHPNLNAYFNMTDM